MTPSHCRGWKSKAHWTMWVRLRARAKARTYSVRLASRKSREISLICLIRDWPNLTKLYITIWAQVSRSMYSRVARIPSFLPFHRMWRLRMTSGATDTSWSCVPLRTSGPRCSLSWTTPTRRPSARSDSRGSCSRCRPSKPDRTWTNSKKRDLPEKPTRPRKPKDSSSSKRKLFDILLIS